MYDLVILNVLHRGNRVDVAIQGSIFAAVEPAGTLIQASSKMRWDGANYLIRPPFYNTHTHQAMTLFRGTGDDCSLMDWLSHHIWPRENRLTPEAVYAGTRLAIVEGLHSGCVGFNDMYFHQPQTIRAAWEMGVRAQIGLVFMNQVSEHIENEATLALRDTLPDTIHLTLAPHAIYTTTPALLHDLSQKADKFALPIHIHAAESLAEHKQANAFGFSSPVTYLKSCGILRPGTILAHACHLSDADRDLLASNNVIIAHCPQSNQKLASGTFEWEKAAKAGISITVGTDGAASNNGLSMIAETKAAALTARIASASPEALPFEALDAAVTSVAAQALGFPNAGRIAPGADADLILVDLRTPPFACGGNADVNFIYAADSASVDTVLCAGKILMRHRHIAGEGRIQEAAHQAAEALRHT